MIRWLLFSFVLLITIPVFAQYRAPALSELITAYENRNPDTTKVRLLLQLDSLYLYQMPDTKNILDSALLMAQQARTMSASLRYQSGYDDATFLFANSYAEQKNMPAAVTVANAAAGSLKVHILIMIGERYLFRPGELKQNIDSAYPYILRAEKLSDSLHSIHWFYQSLCLKAKYYFALGEIENGRYCFRRMIEECHQSGNLKEEAHWWAELGRYMPHADSTYNEVVSNLDHALSLYKKLNSAKDEIELLENLAFLHKLRPGSLSMAEAELQQALKLRQALGSKTLYRDYTDLSQINTLKGNYNISLYYALAAVKNMESTNMEGFSGGTVYSQLATAYKAIGDVDNSLHYYRKALAHLVDYRIEYLFPICGEIVRALLYKDRAKEALSFLQTFVQQNPPPRYIDKEIVAASLGDCYSALRQYNQAESSYQRMIVLDSLAQTHMKQQSVGERSNTITGSEAYYTIGNFYVTKAQYSLGKNYLLKALSFDRFAPSLARQRDIHLLLFKIDSAQNNYLSAIQHLQIQQQLQDSIFNDRKSKQIAELQIQYETEKREKDFQIMRSKEQVKDKELQRSLEARNFTFILMAVLIVLMAVGYSRYILKQKNNQQLRQQQQLINQKNRELQYLVKDKDKLIDDKDTLLEEKEWLLKEVHHRVKNNLQIMTSLLSTQAKYLDNEEAVNAISESRHRMQAMSLIHQKLYESNDTSKVDMSTFISDLVTYLKTSFQTQQAISYDLQLDEIKLDIGDAVPVGLILNEAITNAIKYAFTSRNEGVITVVMKHENDNIKLVIQDNGNGLPPHFDSDYNTTMGIRLMKGLVTQIDGHFEINNAGGVSLKIEFAKRNLS